MEKPKITINGNTATVETWAKEADLKVQEALENTKLPARPNLKAIDPAIQQIVREAVL